MHGSVVMVVDDEPGVIQLCRRLLDKSGFGVLSFIDPQDGLQMLEKTHVDLLLVDMRMPGMDGFEMMASARLHQPDLSVVIMTGYGTLETAIQALQRGADGLVLKPFTGKELVQSVQHALEQSRQKQDVLRLQALRPLFDISETLFSETNPERLQELLLKAVCGHLKCALAAYFRKDGDENIALQALILSDGFEVQKEVNLSGENQLALQNAFMPVLQRAMASSTLEVETFTDTSGEIPASLIGQPIGPVICAPLPVKIAKNLRPLLLAARLRSDTAFREADLEMAMILARQAGIALENAQLHAELHAYIRQLEESQVALIQAEKMAIAGRLTTSIAHEINNPLQSVQNCLYLSRRKELPLRDRQNYLKLAQEELDRLRSTVQRMLEFYRPGALDRKPADINLLINKVLALMEHQFLEHQVRVQTFLASDLPLLYVVSDQIQQVFLNIMLNSIEAMQEGGILYIATSLNQDKVEILFRDTGPGVSASQRNSIFEPFYSTKEGGTGLGLAISYGIITAHAGSLELVDSLGPGASFRISLKTGEL